jgi:hypothetical protein
MEGITLAEVYGSSLVSAADMHGEPFIPACSYRRER